MGVGYLVPDAQQLLHLGTGEANKPFIEHLISEHEKSRVGTMKAGLLGSPVVEVFCTEKVLGVRLGRKVCLSFHDIAVLAHGNPAYDARDDISLAYEALVEQMEVLLFGF